MKPDEQALIDSVLAREDGAFDAFLDRYRSLFYSVLYGKGFAFPRDYVEDVYQSLILAITKDDYRKLRAFTGRNNCSLATFLQVVTTRFALDELRKWKRHPRGRGREADPDDSVLQVEDPRPHGPVDENLSQERIDIFHNLLFALEWKRISVVLWVFRGVTRERIADVMSTSRANIDALYKRAKDQMTQRFADGEYSSGHREPDDDLLVPDVESRLVELLQHPTSKLQEALLVDDSKQRALIGLLLLRYPEYRVSLEELGRIDPKGTPVATAISVLDDLLARMQA
ncbi:MAG: hypothetical protein DHS20C15_18460 [Planctomycetota bacterium]|nr:MAG: hypothetical protein DHS20C15_18460 [Planctomycetota bacterium]